MEIKNTVYCLAAVVLILVATVAVAEARVEQPCGHIKVEWDRDEHKWDDDCERCCYREGYNYWGSNLFSQKCRCSKRFLGIFT